jgi:hypothetical protein
VNKISRPNHELDENGNAVWYQICNYCVDYAPVLEKMNLPFAAIQIYAQLKDESGWR